MGIEEFEFEKDTSKRSFVRDLRHGSTHGLMVIPGREAEEGRLTRAEEIFYELEEWLFKRPLAGQPYGEETTIRHIAFSLLSTFTKLGRPPAILICLFRDKVLGTSSLVDEAVPPRTFSLIVPGLITVEWSDVMARA